MKKILSLDPSFSATGWAIIGAKQKFELIDYGWINTKKYKDIPVTLGDMMRAETIASGIIRLVNAYNITLINSEIPLGSQSANAAKGLGISKGIVATICAVSGIKRMYINPLKVKMILCGNRYAEKAQIIGVVENYFDELKSSEKRKSKGGKFTLFHEAICDAIAVTLALSKISNGGI